MDNIAKLVEQAEHLERICSNWDLANKIMVFVLAGIAFFSFWAARNISKRKLGFNWEAFNIQVLLGAFIAGLLVAFVTWELSASNSRLAEKQKEIIAEKDRKLRADLSAKDLQIGRAQADAQGAAKEAGIANHRAAIANLRAEELKKSNLETEAKLKDTKGKLTWEWSRRTELDIAALPRLMQISFHPNGAHEYDPLVPYAKTSYLIEYDIDGEAFRAAHSLSGFLSAAGWINYQAPSPSHGLMTENVQLGCGALEDDPTQEAQKIWSDCRAAQGALTELLLNQSPMDWQADATAAPSYVPPGVLWIKVGLKPDRFPWREWEFERQNFRP